MRVLVVGCGETPSRLSAMLQRAGLSCETADSDRRCWMACLRSRFDVVFLDLESPHIDGMRATRALHARFPELRVALVSALDERNVMEDLFRCGAAVYLVKPVRPEVLVQTINGLKDPARSTYRPHTQEAPVSAPGKATLHGLFLGLVRGFRAH